MTRSPSPSRTRAAMLAVLLVAGCSAAGADTTGATSAVSDDVSQAVQARPASAVFDTSIVHDVDIVADEDELTEVLEIYVATGEKEWLSATVTIDGVTYDNVGLRLKGNSSLRGISTTTPAETLPWLIRFDKFVDDQNHEGYRDLVVRSNSSDTSLNEAVALDLLDAAGLATQQAIHTTFSVNGSTDELRLVIEHPDDEWMADNFSAAGALYKAESTGDYSYRGDNEDAYDEVFDQEAGKDNTDLEPLMAFLDFVNNSDDATFAAELDDHLDVEAFATYLAMMDLVDNFDDIDGPGNNSYLYYDAATDRFTVLPWDLNLAFGSSPGGGGGFGGPGGGDREFGGAAAAAGADFAPPTGGDLPGRDLPDGFEPPTGGDLPGGDLPEGFGQPGDRGQGGFGGAGGFGGVGGPGGGSNPLVTRFLAVDEFAALYDQALVDLQAELFDSGLARDLLDARVAVLTESGVLLGETVTSEATTLAAALA